MRLDKFLKDSRIIVRRTVAKEAADSDRVEINGKIAKAGDRVEIGDIITVKFGSGDLNVEVLELLNNPRKAEAENMYKVINDWENLF